MQKQPNYCQTFFLLATCTAILFSACKREALIGDPPDYRTTGSYLNSSTSGNSPAAHIAASDKVIIPAGIELPANLPRGNTRAATFYAEGVQKYQAREKAGSNPIAYEWVFVAPQAYLYDATNSKVGAHGAGPNWQLSSSDLIHAQQFSPPRTAPSPDPGSIDWLLLTPKAGTTPTGIFTDVLYIQRIATKGGKAPPTPPAHANETAEVKYKAVYRFTKKNA